MWFLVQNLNTKYFCSQVLKFFNSSFFNKVKIKLNATISNSVWDHSRNITLKQIIDQWIIEQLVICFAGIFVDDVTNDRNITSIVTDMFKCCYKNCEIRLKMTSAFWWYLHSLNNSEKNFHRMQRKSWKAWVLATGFLFSDFNEKLQKQFW